MERERDRTHITMAIVVTLAAVFVRYLLLVDTVSALPTMQPGNNATQQTVMVSLELPPVIYSQTLGPLYITDHNGYTLLWCNGTEGARVTWSYNNQNVSDLIVRAAVLDNEGVQFYPRDPANNPLIVYDFQKKIHGFIQCFVTNSRGSTFGAKVFVTHAVLNKTSEFQDVTVVASTVGDTVTMACHQHIHDTPAATIHWEFSEDYSIDLLQRDGFFCNRQRSACVIPHVKPDDAGTYTCAYTIPNKPLGLSTTFKLTVREPSEYNPYTVHPLNLIDHISSPSLVEVLLGDDVQLICAFRGTNGRYVSWMRSESSNECYVSGDTPLNETSKFTLNRNGTTLRIGNLSWDDQGYYICSADNGFDRYTHRINVSVLAPPLIQRKNFAVDVYVGGTARINCSTSQAAPEPYTTWWVNRVVVDGAGFSKYRLEDNGNTLVLYNASLEDTSSIVCNVSNRVGDMLGHGYVNVLNITAPSLDEATSISMETTYDAMPTKEEFTAHDPQEKTVADSTIGYSGVPPEDSRTLPSQSAPPEVTKGNTTFDDVTKGNTTFDDVTKVHDKSDKDRDIVDPSYTVENIHSGEEGSRGHSRAGFSEPWQQQVWPWILITVVVFVFGLVIGILATRRHMSRHKSSDDDRALDSHSVISNNPSISQYNRQSLRAAKNSCGTAASETQSMMRGENMLMETVT